MTKLSKDYILKIVEEAFDSKISAEGWLDYGTPMASLEGKQLFMNQIADKLSDTIEAEPKEQPKEIRDLMFAQKINGQDVKGLIDFSKNPPKLFFLCEEDVEAEKQTKK